MRSYYDDMAVCPECSKGVGVRMTNKDPYEFAIKDHYRDTDQGLRKCPGSGRAVDADEVTVVRL